MVGSFFKKIFSPAEGIASYVYVALGGSNKPTLTHEKIVINPDYSATTYANNLAMLKLSVPVVADGSNSFIEKIGSSY